MKPPRVVSVVSVLVFTVTICGCGSSNPENYTAVNSTSGAQRLEPAATENADVLQPQSDKEEKRSWSDVFSPGTKIRVDLNSRGEQKFGTRQRSWDMNTSFVLEISKNTDWIMVQQKNHTGWSGKLAPAPYGRLYIVHLVPGFELTEEGKVIDVIGIDQAQERAEKMMSKLEGEPFGGKLIKEQVASWAGLTRLLDEWWAMVVISTAPMELWRKLTGKNFDTTVKGLGKEIPERGRISVLDTDQCGDGKSNNCDNFLIEEVIVDPKGAAQHIEDMLNQQYPENRATVEKSMFTQSTEIVRERVALLPRQLKFSRITRHEFGISGRNDKVVVLDEHVWTYRFYFE